MEFEVMLGKESINNSQIEHAILSYCTAFAASQNTSFGSITLQSLAHGNLLATILCSIDNFQLDLSQLNAEPVKCIERISNLKKIIQAIKDYMETQYGKNVRTEDISATQIAQKAQFEDISKLFELILVTLMESPNKKDHIEIITSLDHECQNTFVTLIQNAIDVRLIEQKEGDNADSSELRVLCDELKAEVKELTARNRYLEKENLRFKDKIMDYEEEMDKDKDKSHTDEAHPESLVSQNEQLKNMIENLKVRLIAEARDHEIETASLREQHSILEMKAQQLIEVQHALQIYQQRYAQAMEQLNKMGELQRQKKRMAKVLDQKQKLLQKLQEVIHNTMEKKEENELYMKIELEKRDEKFKELEGEMKKRMTTDESQDLNLPSLKEIQFNNNDKDELEYVKEEIDKLRSTNRDLEREILKNKKKIEKVTLLETEKKKMERMLVEVSKSRDAEIEMLVVSLYELRTQNIRMHEALQKKQGRKK